MYKVHIFTRSRILGKRGVELQTLNLDRNPHLFCFGSISELPAAFERCLLQYITRHIH